MSSSKVSNIADRTGQRDPSRGWRPYVGADPLVEAKFAVPRRQSVTLRRTRLLRLLRSGRDRSVISIVAPPGYGKTSLLVQWATESSGPVAWLTADDSDSDPVVLLTDLAAAIDRVEPLGTEIFVAIASAAVSNRAVVGRLLAAMSRPPEGVRIAIDDGYRITSRPCLDILAELVAHLPEGSQVAIAGRERMRLPFARWRAEGSLLEIGPAELAMDEREAAGLGRELGSAATRGYDDPPDATDRRVAGPAGARDARCPDARWRHQVDRHRLRSARRRLPAVRGSRGPLRDRDRLPDPHRRSSSGCPRRCATP